jgi:signal transduction histidine kinase
MDESRYEELLQKQGLHGFVLKVSTEVLQAESAGDRWLRLSIISVALVAAGGLGIAWRTLERSSRLQLRLMRASEMNIHLREMNVAAAGLAHETRNPLNIVRGLAQMISQQQDASPDIRQRAGDITDEVDRITGRLNEFIDYSKPREAKPTPTNLSAVIRDVERALASDIEEKQIDLAIDGPELTIEADESLLRQVLFNLLLNSVQAVEPGGKVDVVVKENAAHEASFEVRDNGPGVPQNAREEIFRPYYTTHANGTGLGLAIVRQIVLAHKWDIEYAGDGPGACFRVSGLRVLPRGA